MNIYAHQLWVNCVFYVDSSIDVWIILVIADLCVEKSGDNRCIDGL